MKITKSSTVGLTILLSGSALLWLAGCAPKRRPMPPASRPAMTMQQNTHQRLMDLHAAVASFQEEANALPGADDTEHRYIMEQSFDDLSIALPILVGAEPTGAFRLQMRSVASAREELAANPNLAPEPIEDSGLRSAVGALGRIAHEDFYGGSERAADQLRLALRPLDRTAGPMHRLAVRDLVRQMAEVLQTLAEKYADRVEAPPTKHHRKHTME